MKYSLAFLAASAQAAIHTQTGLYLRTYTSSILSEWLLFDGVDEVMEHGCHCAKLDASNPFQEHLGGSTVVDELDEICRDWLRARNCNDNLVGGSCESDRESMRTGAYTMSIVESDYDASTCGFTTADCEADTCEIDLKYLKLIREYVTNNPQLAADGATIVNSSGTCTQAPLDKRERRCEGDAPDVYPKRMSDLEQLLTRVDWVTDRLEDDEIVYNSGGRKLNDDKEYIDFFVENQLITFGWNNVKSFTFETIDAFNPYYVGWVEKSRVNNFAPGSTDTLGDDTKGGVQTCGIFSGDAMIRAHDGFETPANPPTSFFDAGTTVTCTKEGTNFEFYVNGALVGTVDGSGWNGAYPALDTNARYHVRMTDVIYEDAESDPVDIWN